MRGFDFGGPKGRPNLITGLIFTVLMIPSFVTGNLGLGFMCLGLAAMQYLIFYFVKKGKL